MEIPANLSTIPPIKPKEPAMMTQAKALEASFLSEMLSFAGIGKTPEGFGGGIGEDQFSSFLRDEQAKKMVEHGGIGLAETLFQAMTKGQNHVD